MSRSPLRNDRVIPPCVEIALFCSVAVRAFPLQHRECSMKTGADRCWHAVLVPGGRVEACGTPAADEPCG
jgi:hypothetical protein